MNLAFINALLAVSLFILIWIVQLVIYPSFNFYTEANMRRWHRQYTGRFSIIVLPLMLGQLGLTAYLAFAQGSWSTYLIFALVLSTWLITFTLAVPLHARIEKKSNTRSEREQLIQINWLRTAAWTLILIISLLRYGK